MVAEPQRLADHLAALDAARFTGRRRILAQLDSLLTGTGSTRVALVHGPGGIGKSALLREVARRAEAAGRPVWMVDARVLEPIPGELERVLDGAIDHDGAVVVIDSFERVGALDGLLRERILPGLTADAVVVVAGRHAPSPAWFTGGWEHVAVEVPLGPLSAEEARDLLSALGLDDPAVVDPLVGWAGGSPLALSLGASGPRGAPDDRDLDGVDLNRLIINRLAGDDLDGIDGEVLEVAAVARAVDARLLAAVLPGRPTRAAIEALRRASVAEAVGTRVTLHDLVRGALRDDLLRYDPERYGQLRCAIADHLLARVTGGEPRLLSDLIELVDDPEVRWGIGGGASHRIRIDPWLPGEVDAVVEAYVRQRGDPGWWEALAPVLAQAPELGLVARDADGSPLGFCVAASAGRAPAVIEQDPLFRPLLADARSWNADRSMIFRETFQMAGSGDVALGVLSLSAVLRSGLPDVGRSYILDTQPDVSSGAFFEAVGAVHHPHLDTEIAGRRVECRVIDHGPGGMAGQVRQVIYAESGRGGPDPARHHEERRYQAAVDAVRDFSRDVALAANPLVADVLPTRPDLTVQQRVERLRHVIGEAVTRAFDQSPTEQLLRQVVELGDLDPEVNHDQTIARLSVSRATYFRHLRRARHRVATSLVALLHHEPSAG